MLMRGQLPGLYRTLQNLVRSTPRSSQCCQCLRKRSTPRILSSKPYHSMRTLNIVTSSSSAQKAAVRDQKRQFSNDSEDESFELSNDLEQDEEYEAMVKEHYFLPVGGHQILILQPVIRWGPRKPTLTTADHQLAEACALVKTLPDWNVTHTISMTLKRPRRMHLFGKGQFAELTSQIRSRAAHVGARGGHVTAVFVNVSMLTGLQLVTMQQEWKLPVYDRYTVVLQIFKVHAMSREAKLQVALAEVPYFRSRLLGMHSGMLERGSLEGLGGTGDHWIDARRNLLMEREAKIKKALLKLRGHRQLLRQNRLRKEIPIVAVVGYTNCGKTSLIKTVTGESSMTPRDQLFATLDVTAHSGLLPSRIKVVYMDTVGFISDIPTDLIEAFTATLEDALLADVVVHVRDVSHPDAASQRAEVVRTLQGMNLGQDRMDRVIEVANKCDQLEPSELESLRHDDRLLLTSATQGTGLDEFLRRLETVVMETTGLSVKKMKVPADGPHMGWLYKHATIQEVRSSEDGRSLLVECVISRANLDRFRAEFRPRAQNDDV